MRLHALTLEGFGPFPGVEHVDFDELSAAGLFLLHGATGAGKTTVLDAVCFGLYGVVPGPRQRSLRLRSDHAAPTTPTRVVLEVTLRGRRLRITRSPAWERPKRRGTGTTKEQPKVLVEEIGRDGTVDAVLSTRLDESGQLVRDLLGMSPDQFCQVVLLPQGQFAEFLRADADARRPLLEQVFGTARFSWVEKWLVERRRESWRELELALDDVSAVQSAITEAAHRGADAAPPPALDVPAEEVQRWAEDLAADAARRADAGRAAELAAERLLVGAQTAVDAARERVARADRLAALQRRLDAVERGRDERTATERRLAAARRALAVSPLLERLHDTQADLEVAQARQREASRTLDDPALAGASAARLREVAAAALTEVGSLSELAADEAEALSLATERARLTEACDTAVSDSERLTSRLDAAPSVRTVLAERVDRAREAAASLPALQAAADSARTRLHAARERDALAAELHEARRTAETLTQEALDAREHWLDLRQRRLDGMAGELAARLADGKPCPVCGSAEHPAPAAAAHRVDAQQEDDASQRWQAAEARRESASQRVADLTSRHAAARASAGGDQALAEVQEAAAAAKASVDSTSRLAAILPTAEAALAAHDADCDDLREQLQRRVAECADAQARRAAVEDRLAAIAERLLDALGDDGSVAARVARLQTQARLCTAAADAYDVFQRAERAAEEAQDRAEREAVAAGFTDLTAAEAAVLPAAEIETLQATLDVARAEEVAVRSELADPALAGDDDAPETAADARRALVAAEAHLTGAQQVLAAAAGDAREASTCSARLESLSVKLAHTLDALAPVRERHTIVDGLSRLADGSSGDNTLRMRLSAYVLAARLEQVAVAASERLVRMSSGRYTLEHTDLGASGRGRAGLGLLVRDAWTGVTRETTTLSGGESFFASLALALGLADVVAAEAGGAPIETLFVDEGFGSLDDDTLDEVMAVLDDLREGGRAVGIVSHVADLRARVPAQLHVRKGRHGSTLTDADRGRGAA